MLIFLFNASSRSVSDSLLATPNGQWQGETAFNFSHAAFSYSFNQLATTLDGFDTLIAQDLSLSDFDQASLTHDISYNLINWMTYSKSHLATTQNVQELTLTATPSTVFNRLYSFGETHFLLVLKSQYILLSIIFYLKVQLLTMKHSAIMITPPSAFQTRTCC